jgi:hypothetical protein
VTLWPQVRSVSQCSSRHHCGMLCDIARPSFEICCLLFAVGPLPKAPQAVLLGILLLTLPPHSALDNLTHLQLVNVCACDVKGRNLAEHSTNHVDADYILTASCLNCDTASYLQPHIYTAVTTVLDLHIHCDAYGGWVCHTSQ